MRDLIKRCEWTTREAVELYGEKLREREKGFEAFREELRRIDREAGRISGERSSDVMVEAEEKRE